MWGYMFSVVIYFGNCRGFDTQTEQWLEHIKVLPLRFLLKNLGHYSPIAMATLLT